MKKLKAWAKQLKQQIITLYCAYKHERVPLHAKIVSVCVVAYAFSPIDFIPDFIPVLGFIDEVVLLPLGIMLALKLIPSDILEESKAKAMTMMAGDRPKNWIAGGIIVLLWVVFLAWIILFLINK